MLPWIIHGSGQCIVSGLAGKNEGNTGESKRMEAGHGFQEPDHTMGGGGPETCDRNHIWPYMAIYMAIYCQVWPYMVMWPYIDGHIYGHIWPYIWPYMSTYMVIYMTIYGHIWVYMAIYGHI